MFFGRDEELKILDKRFNSNHFEFGFIYGQRRIGKTTLLDEFAKSHKTLMFFASDSDESSLRRDFSNQLYSFLNKDTSYVFPSWESFFIELRDVFKDEKVMIVFDEYPNILVGHDGKRKNTDFDEKLQNAIDHIFKNSQLSIIIMGSNVSFMERIIKDKNGPLYKRHTFSLFVNKLKWNDALKFVNSMSIDDQIKTLALTDTFPYYLSHVDTRLSFDENLNNFFFNRDALITLDPTFTFSSNMSITGFYLGIMRCLSQKINTIKAISEYLQAESGKVSLYLNELIKARVVTKSTYFKSKRLTYYEINDRMSSFYFRFVSPYLEHIKIGDGLRIKEKNENAIKTFIDHAYEKLCITYLQNLNSEGKLGNYYLSFSNFKADNTSLNRSVEIDIVGEDNKSLLLGECKFSHSPKDVEVINNLKEAMQIEPFSHFTEVNYYIFSHNGFNKDLMNLSSDHLHLLSSLDMIKGV